MGLLVLTPYKPAPATPGDANQIANGFTAIEAVVNAITQANMGAGNKVTASAMSGGPPASPSDGDIWIALAVDANGTVWQFRYNAGSASAFKWEFIGGAPIHADVAINESTASVVYVDLATTQWITLARAGDYDYSFGCQMYNSVNTGSLYAAIVKAGVVQFDMPVAQAGVNLQQSESRDGKITVAAADVLKLQYQVGGGTGQFLARFFKIVPVRVS